MAKLLKRLWEYMELTALPFFGTGSAQLFGGWYRVCWRTNEAFNQASPTKEFWENCPQKKGGHIYDKNGGGHNYENYCTYMRIEDKTFPILCWEIKLINNKWICFNWHFLRSAETLWSGGCFSKRLSTLNDKSWCTTTTQWQIWRFHEMWWRRW